MKFLRYVIFLALSCCFSPIFAQIEQDGDRYDEELNEKDWEALYDYINTKRTINVEEKDVNLAISGDIRTEWRHLNESKRGRRLRGAGGKKKNGLPISRNDFDIEFNLRFDYVCKNAWGVAHVQYDNSAGVDDNDRSCAVDPQGWHGSGHCGDLCLKKAYMGYNVYCCPNFRFDVELGRRNLYTIFDSEVQFLSRFDGLLLKYSASFEKFADWYLNAAGFLVDERVNQFGWVAETGFYSICETGFDFKYSFIWWPKYGKNRCGVNNPRAFRFLNSQWTLYYNFDPALFCDNNAFLYGAIIVNHDASKRFNYRYGENKKTINRHANIAWYVGITIGEVIDQGDWAIDLQYQWVEAKSIPNNDVSGIGRGNVFGESFTETGRGNTNYKGFRLEGLYALTDNLTLDCIIDHTVAIDKHIGGSHRYSKFELEAIYAF